MKITLATVGRLKDGPERVLFERYWERLETLGRKVGLGPLRLIELPESRASSATARSVDEAKRLLAAVGQTNVVLLDETGRAATSEAFASNLSRRRDAGGGDLAYLIGGPDGHGPAARAAAAATLSLSAMTLPHGLARVVFAEQLYRAATILSGHPYHRV